MMSIMWEPSLDKTCCTTCLLQLHKACLYQTKKKQMLGVNQREPSPFVALEETRQTYLWCPHINATSTQGAQ